MSEEEFYSRALSFDEVGKQVDIFEKEKINYEKEIERLNNIIKEVREYINDNLKGNEGHFHLNFEGNVFEILEILDKENEDGKNNNL